MAATHPGATLRGLLSEAGFMAHRVEVEAAWLVALSDAGLPELPAFSEAARQRLRQLVEGFSEADAARIKDIERVTNHDVKAVEYWMKERSPTTPSWLAPPNSSTSPAPRKTSTTPRTRSC